MLTYYVWVATPTFLYLPVYALDRLGVLAQVGRTLRSSDSRVIIQTAPAGEGDNKCIEHMLERAQNESANGEIHIAVADPYAARLVDPKGSRARLLGAFLKAPTFWVLGRNVGLVSSKQKLICYKPSFKTALSIAQRFNGKYGEILAEAEPGEEIDRLFDDPAEVAQPGTLRVLTVDLIGMELACQNQDVGVIERLSEQDRYRNFVTTGVLTHRRTLHERPDEVALFMEALRASCLLLRTARAPTATLVHRLAQEDEFRDEIRIRSSDPNAKELTEAQAGLVADRIFLEGLFDDSLLIRHSEWQGRVDAEALPRGDVAAADRYFFKIYRKSAAVRYLDSWIQRAMADYARYAYEARENAWWLLSLTSSLLIMFGGWRITSFYTNGVNQSASAAWTYFADVVVSASLAFGIIIGLSPWIRRALVPYNLDRFVFVDMDDPDTINMIGYGMFIAFSAGAYLLTRSFIEESFLQGVVLSVAGVLGMLVPIIIKRLFPRLAKR